MIINIHTPNPATLSTLHAMKKVKHWKLEHQVAFLCLDKIFPTWNSLIKGKNLSQLLYDRLWKIQWGNQTCRSVKLNLNLNRSMTAAG